MHTIIIALCEHLYHTTQVTLDGKALGAGRDTVYADDSGIFLRL